MMSAGCDVAMGRPSHVTGRHLARYAVTEFDEHYHFERNHQGLDNELIVPVSEPVNENAPIECRERLGGILEYHHRRAA